MFSTHVILVSVPVFFFRCLKGIIYYISVGAEKLHKVFVSVSVFKSDNLNSKQMFALVIRSRICDNFAQEKFKFHIYICVFPILSLSLFFHLSSSFRFLYRNTNAVVETESCRKLFNSTLSRPYKIHVRRASIIVPTSLSHGDRGWQGLGTAIPRVLFTITYFSRLPVISILRR